MKICITILAIFVILLSCNNKKDQQKATSSEKKELEKVESFEKTDKQKEDSVMAKWQKKMEDSKIGE